MSRKRTPPPTTHPWRRRLVWGALIVVLTAVLGGGGFLAGQTWQRFTAESETGIAAGYPDALIKAAEALRDASYSFIVEQVVNSTSTASAAPTPTPGTASDAFRIASKGAVQPGIFWQSLYDLPLNAPLTDASADSLRFSSLSTPTDSWRNEGIGWFRTTKSTGAGMDPVSAARLPDLLTNLTGVQAVASDTAHSGLTGFSAAADPIDYPGVLVADGFAYTADPILVTVWLDSHGRLARLEATALSLANPPPEQLMVLTIVYFDYAPVGPAPIPSPLRTTQPGPIDLSNPIPQTSPGSSP